MGCLSLLPFDHPAIYVLAPVDDAAAEAEAVWPDAGCRQDRSVPTGVRGTAAAGPS